MGDHRLPKRVMSVELENVGKRGPGIQHIYIYIYIYMYIYIIYG